MIINSKKLKKSINQNLSQHIKKQEYKIIQKNAIDLLTPERFDLLAKYIYIQFKDLNIQSSFGEEIYLAHINAFNGFIEDDESHKIGKVAFLESFDNLIDSVKKDGINQDTIIPLSNNILLDGAHRTATAIYFNKSIQTVDLDISTPNFNYSFFKGRGLSEVYLDFMATKYIELKENIYTIILWPSSGGGKEKELKEILKEYGKVVYRKEVKLKNNAPVHLVKQAYKTENWLGSAKDGFIGAQNKANWCFEKDGVVRVILFESDKNMIEMKDEIREIYQIKKHAIHINDTKEEALELAGLLFNKNSIHWMNHTQLKNMPKYNELFKEYTSIMIDKHSYLLVGAVLSAYGIKDANDLDFICKDKNIINFKNDLIEEEISKMKYINVSSDELIFNPKNYFKINNIKILSLHKINEIKISRKKGSDVEDSLLIKKLLSNTILDISILEKIKLLTNISHLKGKIKFMLLKVRFYLTKFLKGMK